MIGVGILTMGLVANNVATVGDITFGPATMVYGSALVVIGLQAVLFSALAKLYGIKEGLLPYDEKVAVYQRIFTVDRVLLIGILIFVLSLISAAVSIWYWASFEFGPLIPLKILSLAIPSALGIVIGLEVILFGLFSGLLKIERSALQEDSVS